jgi:hypothetical protein
MFISLAPEKIDGFVGGGQCITVDCLPKSFLT